MKKTIKHKGLLIEIILFAILFLIAFAYKVYSLVQINDSWIKVFSQLHIVAGLSAILYIVIGMARLTIRFSQKSMKNFQEYNKPEDF